MQRTVRLKASLSMWLSIGAQNVPAEVVQRLDVPQLPTLGAAVFPSLGGAHSQVCSVINNFKFGREFPTVG